MTNKPHLDQAQYKNTFAESADNSAGALFFSSRLLKDKTFA